MTAPAFDPDEWIAKAILARMDPVLVIPRDGRRGLFCNDYGVPNELRPPALADDADLKAVTHRLEELGRVIVKAAA